MTDPVVTDATKALADVKGVIASVDSEASKAKVFWLDYRAYIVCAICFLIGAFVGHKL